MNVASTATPPAGEPLQSDAAPPARTLDLQQHITGLDGLRGLAAWMVVFSHFRFFSLPQVVDKHMGEYGVFLFFVLSGFLMGHLYLPQRFTAERATRYLAARISRIVPLYFTVLILGWAAGHFLGSDFRYGMSTVELIKHLLFVGHIANYWSMAPEFQFYFLFPLLWWLCWLSPARTVRWGVPLLVATLAIIATRSSWPGILVFSKLHIFLGGIAVALLRPGIVRHLTPAAVLAAQIAALGFLVALFLPASAIGPDIYPYVDGDIKNNAYYADIGKLLVIAFTVGALSLRSPLTDRVLGNALMVRSGKYSFSIYLLHYPILYAFEKLGLFASLPPMLGIAALLATVLVIAALSFHAFEDPVRVRVRDLVMRLFSGWERLRAMRRVSALQQEP